MPPRLQGGLEPGVPLHVLHLAAGNLFGGVETVLVNLARGRGECPNLSPSFSVFFPGRLQEELQSAGAPVACLGAVRWSRPWTVLAARKKLKALLARSRPHVGVSHSSWVHAIAGPVLQSAGVPLAFMQHGSLELPGFLDRLAARTAPVVVLANSRYTARNGLGLFKGVPREVWHCPLPGASREPAAPRAKTRRELGTPDDVPVILQVSRMESWKGQARHLEALAPLVELPWELWLVGGAQRPSEVAYETQLKQLARALGIAERVRFLGERRDVPALLAAADIFCQPNSEPESYGMVFLEALRAGLPVISSAVGGPLEIVDGSCGLLVGPGVAPVTAAMERLLREPALRKHLSGAAPARAEAVAGAAQQLAQLDGLLRRWAA